MDKEKSNIITVELETPVEYNGKTYKELSFDFEKLTGKDSMDIERELNSQGILIASESFNGMFLARAAARACTEKIGVDIFQMMKMRDFNVIKGKARNFLA
ncbi:MAG: phage tail assembly protein [Bacteroidales bacterium]|nr:phage tail assembly protein [Bacteroidales bacterium]